MLNKNVLYIQLETGVTSCSAFVTIVFHVGRHWFCLNFPVCYLLTYIASLITLAEKLSFLWRVLISSKSLVMRIHDVLPREDIVTLCLRAFLYSSLLDFIRQFFWPIYEQSQSYHGILYTHCSYKVSCSLGLRVHLYFPIRIGYDFDPVSSKYIAGWSVTSLMYDRNDSIVSFSLSVS